MSNILLCGNETERENIGFNLIDGQYEQHITMLLIPRI